MSDPGGARTYEGFQDAYLANLNDLKTSYSFDVAPRGQGSLEKLGVGFRIRDPVQRVCLTPARRTNIVFNVAEALWYLRGDDRVDVIAYYAPSIRRYSADGKVLTGTAYGPRLFGGRAPRGESQWQRVVDLLRRDDPSSKRAVISVFDPAEELSLANIDVSCTLGLQFLLRQGRLHLVAFMRANDAYRGIVSDVFSFTFLQEVMARQLGVEVGEYHHAVGSMHLYKADLDRASAVLSDADLDHRPRQAWPAMPRGDNWPYIRRVLEVERALREQDPAFDLRACEAELPAYWYQIVLLLALFRRVVKDHGSGADLVAELLPVYRWLVRNRWPELAA